MYTTTKPSSLSKNPRGRVGIGYYIACSIGKASPDEAMTRTWPNMAPIVLALICVAAIPWLTLGFLPKVH
jgi:TRAP-type C4-dicarboxylate transport system permease large subunit